MIDRKEIELLIRAQLKGGRDLASITESITKLEKAIESQAAAAKRGESSYDQLRASLDALKSVQDELTSRSRLVNQLEEINRKIGEQATKVDTARAKYNALNVELKEIETKGGTITDKQQESLVRLQKRLDSASKTADNFARAQETIREALTQTGIETSKLADTQARIQELQFSAAQSFNRVNEELREYGENTRRARDANKAAESQAKSLAAAQDRLVESLKKVAQQRQAVETERSNRTAQSAAAGNEFEQMQAAAKRANELAELRADIERRSAQTSAARAAEQAESDRLAAIQAAAKAEQQQRGKVAAESELAAIKDSTTFMAKFAADQKKAADAAAQRAKTQEQIVFNQRAENEAFLARQARSGMRESAESELATIKESEEFIRKYEAAKKAAFERDAGLVKTADDAENAARQYQTLARASTDLRPKVVSLRDAVDSIINPGKAATATLDGVEEQVKKLSAVVAASKGPIQDYYSQFRELQNAQRAISGQANLIDGFQKQNDALRRARAELVAAREQVKAYAAEVRKGGDAGASFVKPLAEAETRLKRASSALREQISVTRESRDALRNAGINTSNLADAQKRLVNTATQATTASKQLTENVRKFGEAAGGGAKGFTLFRDEGRTTLSLLQRIRGEVLALAASYVGLQGVIGLAGGSIKAFNEREGVRSQLSIAFGTDRQTIDAEYAYIKQQADRIGIEFERAGRGYAKFAASAALAGRSREEIRYIFETFSEVGRVANLSADDLDGVFKALEQITSKGKIQAEELRGQLGDRLFGAFQVAAQALKDQFPNLDKALEQGQVSATQLLAIAEKYREMVQGPLALATDNLAANQARFNNAVTEFKLAVADGGFADAYLALLKDITAFLKSEDGKQFAQDLSDGFTTIVNVIREAIKWFKELQLVVEAFAIYISTKWVLSAVGGLAKVTAAVGILSTAMKGLLRFIPLVGTAIIAWDIGGYLFEKFQVVRNAVAYLTESIQQMWAVIKLGAITLWNEFPRYAENAFKAMLNAATLWQRQFLGILKAGADALGLNGLSQSIQKAIDGLTFNYNTSLSGATKDAREQFQRDLKAIKALGDELRQGPTKPDPYDRKFARQGKVSDRTAKPITSPAKPLTGPTDGQIKQREAEIEALTRALEILEAKIDRSQTDTLAKQLEAIDTEYAALSRRINEFRKVDAEKAAAFQKQLDDAVQQLKLQTTRKFNDKLLDEQQALLSKIEQAEAAAGRKDKTDLDARLKAIADSYAATYRQIADQRAKLEQNGRDTAPADESQRRLDAAVLELQNAERQKFLYEELERRQKQITDTVRARQDFITAIKDQEEAGALSREEAERRIRQEIVNTQPVIDQLVAAGLLFAESVGMALDPTKVEAFRAALAKAQVSGDALNVELFKTSVAGQTISKVLDASLSDLSDSLVAMSKGTMSIGDAFKSMGRVALKVLADVLRELAMAAIKAAVFKAIMGAFGGGGNMSESFTGAPVFHGGGVAGRTNNRTRHVPRTWFAAAPRYHSGGIAGLAPSEYPAILERGEEVLSKSNPRNVMNGGLSKAGASESKPQRFVLVDDRSRVAEAMNSTEGEEVTLVHLRKNIPTLRALLKG